MSIHQKRPYDAITGEELPPRDAPGYYPGYSTMAQASYWDDATRTTVEKRLEAVPAVQFFQPNEAALLEAVLARMLPQDDRTESRKIALLPWIDQRLHRNELAGFRYEDMPPDQEAYRRGLVAMAAMSREAYGTPFEFLTVHQQELLLKSIHDGAPQPDHEAWHRMNVHRWWSMVLEDAVEAYYSHPWAWDEVGYGGPAYPRGYMRLEGGLPEPWEVHEQRYEWNAPVDSVSSEADQQSPPEHGGSHGHGGTH